MIIKKAKIEELDDIFDIYKNAIDLLNEKNIHQWDEAYPTKNVIEQDILKGQMYIGIENGKIVSVAVINNDFDEQYINGNWLYDNFVVIHRVCVNPIYQNQKIGQRTMSLIEDLLKNKGIESIRLDAYSKNPHSLHMYEKIGYKKTGETNWRKGLFYLYEKKI